MIQSRKGRLKITGDAVPGILILPFVIPTGAKRSGATVCFVKRVKAGLVVEKAWTGSTWETLRVSHFPPTLRRLEY